MASQKCVICSEEFIGYGNNAMPLKEGQCCDECNKKVIEARIDEMVNRRKVEE